MDKELQRILVPKITFSRLLNDYITHSMTIHSITFNLILASYVESLKLSGIHPNK